MSEPASQSAWPTLILRRIRDEPGDPIEVVRVASTDGVYLLPVGVFDSRVAWDPAPPEGEPRLVGPNG